MPYIGQLPGLLWDERSGKYFPLSKNRSIEKANESTPKPSTSTTVASHPPKPRNPQRYTDAIDIYDKLISKRLRSTNNSKICTDFYPIRAAAYLAEGRAIIATSQINSQLQSLNVHSEERRYILESNPGSVESLVRIGSDVEVGVVKVAFNQTNLYQTDFEAQSLKHVQSIPNSNYFDCAWDGQRYLLAIDKTLNVIGRRRQWLRYKSDVVSVASLSKDESLCGLRNGQLHLNDWRIGNKPQPPIQTFDKSVNRLKRVRDGSLFIISTMDSQLLLFDVRMNKAMSSLSGNVNRSALKQPFTTVANDSHLCVVGEDAVLRTWSLRTSQLTNSQVSPNTNYIDSHENNLLLCKATNLECITF